MAKKPTKTSSKSASSTDRKATAARGVKTLARSAATRRGANPFQSVSIHITDPKGRRALEVAATGPTSRAGIAAPVVPISKLNPETAAKRILRDVLASAGEPRSTAAKTTKSARAAKEMSFKSLGSETVPLTGTTVVKFRQFVDDIAVYGSLATVELGEKNMCISVNLTTARPLVQSTTAHIAPAEARAVVAKAAGYASAKTMPSVTPDINLYADSGGIWHLAYIFGNVLKALDKRLDAPKRSVRRNNDQPRHSHYQPRSDFIVDALSGKLIAEVPRTPALASETVTAPDELGVARRFRVTRDKSRLLLIDPEIMTETHDFEFQDPAVNEQRLPGKQITAPPPFSSAAISAHANAGAVAEFLRNVLKRNNIDNKGGKLVSVINAVVKAESPDGRQWFNAFWDSRQMVYGQTLYDGKLRSLAASLDVVAHEFFHGVTEHTAQLAYERETGALNESYSDIFGTIISNFADPDIGTWNWLIGDGLSSSAKAFRSMANPSLYGQPKTMRDYRNLPNDASGDWGGVHTNSGIHNYAAYKVMTSKQSGRYVFKPAEAAAIFYIALSQYLSRQSIFGDSRRAAIAAARSLFRVLPADQLRSRVRAIERAFDAAGITEEN